jgi:EAL domain-containing protein (putative c-di-GMP-specific phosphodiesterase class I)
MGIQDLILNEKFFHHYQPIYQINDHEIMGYEGLLRSSEYSNPELVFDLARKEKQLYELDSRSIHKAALTYSSSGYSIKEGILFLNVLPSTILNPNFPSFVKTIMNEKLLSSQQIVFEITEQEATDFESIKNIINFLRKFGLSIAIDDFGNGFLDVQKIIEIEPEYIKLDRYFSQELSRSVKKQDVIKFLLEYCQKFNIDLILEGLETTDDIEVSKMIGVNYGQGFGLDKPGPLKPLDNSY